MNNVSSSVPVPISVCICTFKRPAGLKATLDSVLAQAVPATTTIEVVVVDNDPAASARDLVQALRMGNPSLQLVYANETEPGVSFARNRCLLEAKGAWVAFIDDDEIASANWLTTLVSAAQSYSADAVFGPVLPIYEMQPPDWLVDGGVVSRGRFASGTPVSWPDARTGNVLMSRRLVAAVGKFDVRFAKTGGEDSLFFARAQAQAFKMVWCDEATVDETVPIARMNQKWILRRAFLGGRTFTRLRATLFGQQEYIKWTLHGFAMIAVYSVPAVVMWGFKLKGWLYYLRKIAGATGKIVAPFYGAGEYGGG